LLVVEGSSTSKDSESRVAVAILKDS
jgi:hypothetical protein